MAWVPTITAGGRQIDVTDGPRHRPLRDTLYRGLNETLDAYEDMRPRPHPPTSSTSWPDGEPFDLAAELARLPDGDPRRPHEPAGGGLAVACRAEHHCGPMPTSPAPPASPCSPISRGGASSASATRSDDLFRSLMSTEIDGRKLASADVVCNTYNVLLGTNVTLPQTAAATLLTLMESGRYREWAGVRRSDLHRPGRGHPLVPRRPTISCATPRAMSSCPAARSPREMRSPCGSRRPTATRRSSTTRTPSTSGASPTNTSASVPGLTTASATRWRSSA